jgi:hypothetical protein
VFLLKYELGFSIPKDDILHSHRRENIVLNNSGNRVSCLGVSANFGLFKNISFLVH